MDVALFLHMNRSEVTRQWLRCGRPNALLWRHPVIVRRLEGCPGCRTIPAPEGAWSRAATASCKAVQNQRAQDRGPAFQARVRDRLGSDVAQGMGEMRVGETASSEEGSDDTFYICGQASVGRGASVPLPGPCRLFFQPFSRGPVGPRGPTASLRRRSSPFRRATDHAGGQLCALPASPLKAVGQSEARRR